ncbi:MAG: hypothetical protein ACUVTP_00500 [Candidatus Fervidibacter sp.]|uniref:hypothetical protein n=1 Tax=Candidatus Fervidibacter sp. TaxID=3100871 RepID=UPI00404AEC4A
MVFPIAAVLGHQADIGDIEQARKHWLDTVVVPIDQNNWRKVRNLMTSVHEIGLGVKFILWAKGKQAKSVSLQKLANHPSLTGWLVQDTSDPVLIAMLKATTEEGLVWSWQQPNPFVSGILTDQPSSHRWWAWVSVDETENLSMKVFNAIFMGADGICFSHLPNETDLKGMENLKAIGFFAVHLSLWKPLLERRSSSLEAWEWKAEEGIGRVWNLENGESICLFIPTSPSNHLTLRFPFPCEEGVRSYAVQFPVMVRLPLQRKGENTVVKLNEPQLVNLIWLTKDMAQVQRMHRHSTELTPKAMQFAVQWVTARKERLTKEGKSISGIDDQLWSMLQKARRRQFSQGYQIACQILKATGALPFASLLVPT